VSDIFISYASEDRERAAVLATALQDLGWSVWWDRDIPTGQTFVEVIKKELESSKCTVVLWSQHSTASPWVQREARLAADQRKLFPVLIEEMAPPWEFSELQACDLANWVGDMEDPGFQRLVTDLRGALASASTDGAERAVEERPRDRGRRSLSGFLRTPLGYAGVGAAFAAALGLFAPDRLIPEPLQGLRPVISLYVAATFVLVWAWRASIRNGLKRFATITFVLALVFAGLNLLVVRPVTYSRGSQTIERHFLTGIDPVHPEDVGQSAEDLIKTYGDGWSDLVAIWGTELVWIAGGYALTYLALILGMVLSVAASDVVQPGKRP
jgi:TIR domain